jgi:acetyltransferase-like isoleucine patch superfamily enzyme
MPYKFDGKAPTIGQGTYVSDIAWVIGDVVIGENCYIGHGVILRADYGRIVIGDGPYMRPAETERPPRHYEIAAAFLLFDEKVTAVCNPWAAS